MSGYRGWLFAAVMLSACWMPAEQAAAGGVAAVHPVNHCSNTSLNALRACESAAINHYWVIRGQCENLGSADERRECQETASKELVAALLECREEYDVRQEICEALGEEPYNPEISPANFVSGVDHPYLPFTVGSTLVYEGETMDGFEHIESYVSGETVEILGVECLVVIDSEWIDGALLEVTHDYFAQDIHGNVWYFGESAWIFEDDTVVSVEGSWLSGEDGAKPGVIMQAYPPLLGLVYRQEFSFTEAEDMGEVLSLTESITIPFGAFDDCMQTRDTSPLEPDATEQKFYASNLGLIMILNPDTGEQLELVDVIQD